jgi:hypothetical protein
MKKFKHTPAQLTALAAGRLHSPLYLAGRARHQRNLAGQK